MERFQRELADAIIRQAPIDEIRILLACGAKVNEPVTQGLRPLHYATYQRYEQAVNLFLVRGCDVNAMDDVGYTALHLCAERGYNDLMKLLIKNGARIKFTQITDYDQALGNPPRATIADEPLRLAIKNGHIESAEILLKNGADPNARYFLGSEINLISPLNVICLEMLLKYGAHPDSRDRAGLTPLMKSCRHPHGYAAAKILIYYGADVNAITSERHDYRSVLHYAVLSNNIDIVRLLLHHGANARYIFPTPASQKPTPLDFALLSGNVEMVRLLIDAGADVNVGSPIIGRPLHIVLSEKTPNRSELVDMLLAAGADPNAITKDSRGPLLKPPIGEYLNANEAPQIEIIRKLLKYGARIVLKAQTQDRIGILKSMNRLDMKRDYDVINLLLECCESYNIQGIKRFLVNDLLKKKVLENVTKPPKLQQLCRKFIRNILVENLIRNQSKIRQKQKERKIQRHSNCCPLNDNGNNHHSNNNNNGDDDELNEFYKLTDAEQQKLNQMSLDDIEEAFIIGVGTSNNNNNQNNNQNNNLNPNQMGNQNQNQNNMNFDRLKLLTILLHRSSNETPKQSFDCEQLIELIQTFSIPDILKKYLNYEISFNTLNELLMENFLRKQKQSA